MVHRVGGASDDDRFLAALVEGATRLPQSRVLDRLVGSWRASTEWEPLPGRGVRRSVSDCEIEWILDGRVLESRTFDDHGVETAKLLIAFDPAARDYVCFSTTSLSNSFHLERGHHHEEPPGIVFAGEERVARSLTVIAYHRTFTFDGPDRFTTSITYPDVPPGTYGGMVVHHVRTHR